MGEITETSGFGEKSTTILETEAQPERTKYLTMSAMVIFVLLVGLIFVIIVTSRGEKASYKEARELTESDNTDSYVYVRRKATVAHKRASGRTTKRKKTAAASSSTSATAKGRPKAATDAPRLSSTKTAVKMTSPPIKMTSLPTKLTKKPAKTSKPRRASKRPIATVSVTTAKKPAKTRKTTPAKVFPPVLGDRPLVCAYGNGSHDPLLFPADGVCDAVFFDSLYKYPGHMLASVDNGSLVQLSRFIKQANKYSRTRFGMGVAAEHVETAKAEFSSNTAKKHYLPYLWANKVYDLGVLDFIPDEKTGVDEVKLVFDLLQEYKRLQGSIPKRTGLKTYVVLGIALFKKYDDVYEVFNQQIKKSAVDVLILRTHFSGRDDKREDCVIQGSTYWKGSLTQYHPSLNYTLMYMDNNKKKFKRTKVLISMSLAGRWYRSMVGGKKKSAYMVGVRCKPYERDEYLYELERFTDVTEDPSYGPEHTFFDEKRFVMVSYNPAEGYALIFDSAATIYMKMCLSYTVQGSVPFGLALFDAEYDRWSKKGNKTANFPLTRSARKAVDDIKYDSAASSNVSMKCVASE